MKLLRLIHAEWRKLRGRGLAYAILLFGALPGLVAAGLLYGYLRLNQQVDPTAADSLDWLVAAEVGSALAGPFPLNAFVLMLLIAVLWAEDYALGTAGMIYVRPVPRLLVFLAKAITGLLVCFASVAAAALLAALAGLVLFGASGDPSLLAGGPFTFAAWMGELGFVAKAWRIGLGVASATTLMLPALAISSVLATVTRSPLLSFVGTVLLLIGDALFAGLLFLWGKTELSGHEAAATLYEWTFFASRDFWPLHGADDFFAQAGSDLGRTIGYSLLLLAFAAFLHGRLDER